MKAYGITDRGKIRIENQDAFRLKLPEGGNTAILVLCDGMGGAHGGSTASTMASEAFLSQAEHTLETEEEANLTSTIREAAAIANLCVYERSCTDKACRGMGTTLVAAIVRGDEAVVANIGDSRCYWFRNGKVRQVTKDHSLVRDLVDRGVITAEEARTHPRKNIITRAVGLDKKVKCDVYLPELQENDLLLFCSDGLSNMVSPAEMLETLNEHPDLEEACQQLLALALDRGAPDNVTIVLFVR